MQKLMLMLVQLVLLPSLMLSCSWRLLRGGSRVSFPLLDPLGHRGVTEGGGLLVGERVITVSLVLGAGGPRRVSWDGSGFDFVFRQGLGVIVVEGCTRARIFGLADAWFLAPALDSRVAGRLGGRQVPGKEAETHQEPS